MQYGCVKRQIYNPFYINFFLLKHELFLFFLLLPTFCVIVCIDLVLVVVVFFRVVNFLQQFRVFYIHNSCPTQFGTGCQPYIFIFWFFIHPDRVPCASCIFVMTIFRSVRPSTNHDWYDMLSRLISSTTGIPRFVANVASHKRSQWAWTTEAKTRAIKENSKGCIQVSNVYLRRVIFQCPRPIVITPIVIYWARVKL